MSAFADQMERGNSTQSLPSRGNSEMGSSYLVESGLYMTSFAATIFIAALITVGVLVITLLITLTVMLQSCQNKSAGIIRHQVASVEHGYCREFALYAELNGLKADEFPAICKTRTIQNAEEEQYLRDLTLTMRVAEGYFNNLEPENDGLDVVLMDIDGMLTAEPVHATNLLHQRFHQYDGNNQVKEGTHPVGTLILELLSKLQSSGWPLIFISRMPEKQRNATIEFLISAGYGGWSSLIMRLDDEIQMENWEYFSRRRMELHHLGFRITSVISSHMDALTGPFLGKRIFKLPNPYYYKLERHHKSMEPQ